MRRRRALLFLHQHQRSANPASPVDPFRIAQRSHLLAVTGGRGPMARAIRGLVLSGYAVLLAAGCAKSPPPVVDVSGVLLLDGQPLPNAKVEFIPQIKGF